MGQYGRKLKKAEKVYANTWDQVSKFYGSKGQPAPTVNFLRGPDPTPISSGTTAAHVFKGPTGMREVTVGRPMTRELASKFGRKGAQHALAHEFRHVYQNPELYYDQRDLPHDQQPIEADAISFSQGAMSRLTRSGKIRQAKLTGDKRKVSHARARPVAALDETNASQNYGKDPTTIYYPGEEPSGMEGLSGLIKARKKAKRRAS